MSKFLDELQTINDPFIQQIAQYLLSRDDIQNNLEKENKSLKEMYEYIMGEMYNKYVKENGMQTGGCTQRDEDIYSLAVHYYDEDDIKIEKIKNAVVKQGNVKEVSTENNELKLTDVPKKEKKKKNVVEGQLNLFDFI